MNLPAHFRRRPRTRGSSQQGYVLLTIMMFATMLIISLAAVAPRVAQEIRRDREEEMIHRGSQYARAVRRYYKKFGRFPGKIEDLENTNNIRFLRQRYTDPIDGKEFKLVYFGDVQLLKTAVVFNPSLLGSTPQGSAGNAATQGAAASAVATASQISSAGMSPAQISASDAAPVTDPSNLVSATPAAVVSSPANSLTGRTSGGGPVVGVVSESPRKTIREFNGKNHYNDWQFVYDPTRDRGGLLNAPYQPSALTGPPQVQPFMPSQ